MTLLLARLLLRMMLLGKLRTKVQLLLCCILTSTLLVVHAALFSPYPGDNFLVCAFPCPATRLQHIRSSVASIHGMRQFMHICWEPCKVQTACGTCTVMLCSDVKHALHSLWYQGRHVSRLCRIYVAPRCRWIHSETSVTLSKAYSVHFPFSSQARLASIANYMLLVRLGTVCTWFRTFYT